MKYIDETADRQLGLLRSFQLAQAANVCMQAALLAVALLSLAYQTNSVPPWIAVVVAVAGVMLLGVAELITIRGKALYDVQITDIERIEADGAARLADLYAQGRAAEKEQDWPSAVAHYRAVSNSEPGYKDVAARLSESSRRRDIAALQEQLRAMFTTGEFQAVVDIGNQLAELDPSTADPDGLTAHARQRLQQRKADMPPTEPTPTAIPIAGTGPAGQGTPIPAGFAQGPPQRLPYSAPSVDGGTHVETRQGPAAGDDFAHVGRNDPCPCGSGRKFRRCHGDPRMRPDA